MTQDINVWDVVEHFDPFNQEIAHLRQFRPARALYSIYPPPLSGHGSTTPNSTPEQVRKHWNESWHVECVGIRRDLLLC